MGYDFGKQQGKINHLLFIDDLKLFDKTEGQLETLINSVRVFSSDINMEFGIEKCGILVMVSIFQMRKKSRRSI